MGTIGITSILDYLEHTAATYPHALAYCSDQEQFSWQEVEEAARRIGENLLYALADQSNLPAASEKHQPLVAIFMEKAPHTVTAMLGSVYAGGCYTVLNTALWETTGKQLADLLAFLEPDIFLYDATWAKQAEQLLSEHASRFQDLIPLFLETSEKGSGFMFSVRPFQRSSKASVLVDSCSADVCPADSCLIGSCPDSAGFALSALRTAASPEDTLCLTFTSSSSGQPKCVETSHLAVIRYIDALTEILQATEATVFGNQAPFCFDACMKELFVSMKCGGSAWLLPSELFSRPAELIHSLNQHQINTICWVSSAYSLIAATDGFAEGRPEFLRTAAFGSEVLSPSVLAYWQAALPDVSFFNLYGPTEATGMSCYYPVPKNFADSIPLSLSQEASQSNDLIPIGRPFPGVEVFLLDETGQPVPDGEPGELYLKSNRLAKGYYRQKELTEQVFLKNIPLMGNFSHRRNFSGTGDFSDTGDFSHRRNYYRTGDLAKRLPSGDLVFLGRKDSQVKRMGYRIDLAELERLAAGCPHVKGCCCVQKADGRIVLYVLGGSEGTFSSLSTKISALLRQCLPAYALPNRIILRDSFPFLPNGKIDRNRLREE